MKARRKIGLLTSNEGHFSISEAIREALEAEYDVAIYKQNIAFNLSYKWMYRLMPSLFSIPFYFKDAFLCLLARKSFFLMYKKKLIGFLESEKPDLCISTYFMYIAALEWYREETGTQFANIVTDPWSIHPIGLAASPTLNVTFDETSSVIAQESEFPVTLQPWGWFVRSRYEKPYDPRASRKALGLKPDVLTFLLAGGSEGSVKISELLPHLLKSEIPLQLIVACGSNRLMYRQIKLMYGWNLPDHIQLIPLGFTTHLERYLRAADLVIGKAGPNMLFEAVATLTPFFAITHISGQEDGNLDLIKKYQLGYVEERLPQAAELLHDIIRHPQQLAAFQTQLKSLAEYNRSSKTKLLKYVQKMVG